MSSKNSICKGINFWSRLGMVTFGEGVQYGVGSLGSRPTVKGVSFKDLEV